MLRVLPVLAAAADVVSSSPFQGEALRPWYHFTRLSGEMNDPNGLQWRRLQGGQLSYEMFHQHNNGSTACYGSEGSGDVWGHASSPDLVRWTRLPLTQHMVCASTGGGITLPADFRGPSGERWLSANLGSAPAMKTFPDETIGRGLKLWTSNDSRSLNEYLEYLPPGTRTIDSVTRQNNACVICPEGVRQGPSNPPNWTRAADIGDSYIWSDPEWDIPSDNRTFYAISGQGRCPEGGPAMWCGWARGREPQALLWSSKNLVDWKFVSEFYNGTADDFTAVMTPETFTLATGEQVFIWLGSHDSLWITGAASRREGELYKFHEERFNGNPSRGPVDVGGGTHCGQSMWDAKGRRIQFMWLKLNLPGANWTGAQTIPREIALAPAGSSSGLLFKPIVEMATLHASVEPAINEAFETGARRVFSPPDGLHCHVKANLTLQEGSAVAITVRDSEGDMADAHGSLLISAQLQNGEYTVVFGEASVQVSLPGSLRLEIFVDGPVVELFVNGGERVLTTNSGNPQYISDTKLSVEGNGVAATVTLQVWSMAQAVSGPGDHQVVV